MLARLPENASLLIAAAIVAIVCLFAVHWKKAWPVLASGGWLALVLMVVMTAYVWSLIRPGELVIAGITLPNYAWKLGTVGLITGLGLFCGWLQGNKGWEPETFDLEPPAHGHHDAHHGHH